MGQPIRTVLLVLQKSIQDNNFVGPSINDCRRFREIQFRLGNIGNIIGLHDKADNGNRLTNIPVVESHLFYPVNDPGFYISAVSKCILSEPPARCLF